ncbi:hypothetical protein IEU95_09240 [Hoyosella rhizosphaerae]|uniref:AbiEi antitoxin C-terminal domain-containing protein n=1 Tax=Hoyosella rhizosphaerae TaxID=1755582 RepID=A0A916TZS3_9ACTN|nr:hypothetical protein [Hoyosella rhizosphaerae]MBN4927016.1 hypothetical protein [Hoyosella rhizosphaerae]GGC54707.1 hypothetical protein GCM10011410_03860 [Hoyosella rhizosphaerae]
MTHFDPRTPFKSACRSIPHYAAGRKYRRLFDGVYADKSAPVTQELKARAAWLWADGNCVLSGVSAAAVWRVKWLPEEAPPEIVVNKVVRVKGLIAHRDLVVPQDVAVRSGMRVTTPARTAFDLARRLSEAEAIPLVDALYQATNLSPASLRTWAESRPGYKGIRRLRRVIELSDAGAESPRETHLRLLIIDAALPRPVSQYVVLDHRGGFIGRADLAWPHWKVALEYEGAHHFDDPVQARRDALRANAYMQAGWLVIRVISGMVRQPDMLLNQITSTLRAAGAPI